MKNKMNLPSMTKVSLTLMLFCLILYTACQEETTEENRMTNTIRVDGSRFIK